MDHFTFLGSGLILGVLQYNPAVLSWIVNVTLASLDLESSLFQPFKNLMQMVCMFLGVSAVDDNVVNIHKTYSAYQSRQNRVHGALENGGSITETKGHTFKFIQPKVTCKCSLFSILLCNGDLPES